MALTADLLRGNTDTILLRLLMNKDSYGYEINKQIEKITDGQVIFSEATLYTAFRRLEKEGLIVSRWGDENSGARRRYYHLTEAGEKEYQKRLKEWRQTYHLLERLMEDGND